MKHNILFVGLALLLSACVRASVSASGLPTAVVTATSQYPDIFDPLPSPTPFSGPLTVTVNVRGEPQGDWAGWQISQEFSPNILEPNCTLYPSPDNNSVWEQWIGKCVYPNLAAVYALPWVQNDIVVTVQDIDGRLVAMYTSDDR